eukprot:gene17647-20346_t
MGEWVQNPSRRGVTYMHQDYEPNGPKYFHPSVELQFSRARAAVLLGLIAPSLPTSKDNPSLERKPRGIDRGYRSLVCSCAVDHL